MREDGGTKSEDESERGRQREREGERERLRISFHARESWVRRRRRKENPKVIINFFCFELVTYFPIHQKLFSV